MEVSASLIAKPWVGKAFRSVNGYCSYRLMLESCSNAVKYNSACNFGATIFPCSTECSMVPLELVISGTRPDTLGCSRIFSATLSATISDCVESSKLL